MAVSLVNKFVIFGIVGFLCPLLGVSVGSLDLITTVKWFVFKLTCQSWLKFEVQVVRVMHGLALEVTEMVTLGHIFCFIAVC